MNMNYTLFPELEIPTRGRKNRLARDSAPADDSTIVPMPARKTPPRMIDLFAGVGGFRLAFESLGARTVFSCEWDKFAQKTYEANFGELPAGDIHQVPSSSIPKFDILTGGFPCQPFSIAGVSKKNSLGRSHGFQDERQGDLFFEIARILHDRKPGSFLLENVKNLLSHNRGETFASILHVLEKDLGYHVKYQVLNASSLVPQNRPRLFIAGFKRATHHAAFEFPDLDQIYKKQGRRKAGPAIKEILDKKVDARYQLSDKLWNYLVQYKEKHRRAGHGFGFGLVEPNGIARTLSARYYKDGSEILIPVSGGNPSRLTPRECARLMGFPEDFEIVVSDTQAYKQFGNSVAVPVVREIARNFLRAMGFAPAGRRSGGANAKRLSA